MEIIEFYEKNLIEKNFDDEFYITQTGDIKSFYQPYCRENSITERQRLFYHYVFFVKNLVLYGCREEFEKLKKEEIKKNNQLRGRDDEIDLRELDKYVLEEEIENTDGYVVDHNRNYFINKYARKVLSTMSSEEKDDYILNAITKKFEEMNNIQVQEIISEKYPEIILGEID
jgi:hypothetical protein